MKKLLSLFVMFSIAISNTIFLFGCNISKVNKSYLPPNKPKKEIIKDIFYFQELKKEILEEIEEYNGIINEIENIKNEYENEDDYQQELNEIKIEQLIKKIELSECEYKIFNLQKNKESNEEDKLKEIEILEKKKKNLSNLLNLIDETKSYNFNQKEIEKYKFNFQETKNNLKKLKEQND